MTKKCDSLGTLRGAQKVKTKKEVLLRPRILQSRPKLAQKDDLATCFWPRAQQSGPTGDFCFRPFDLSKCL